MIVHEANYKEMMDTVVWPYLKEREHEFYMDIRGGYKLHVCRYHADHADKVVVISHGFTETAHKYGEMIARFLENHYEVYILDHCGHGKSYRLVEDPSLVHVDSYERYIRDLLKVVSRARRENPDLPLTLLGHSMGGGIACAAAGRRPELFDRVILCSPMIRMLTGAVPFPVAHMLGELCSLLGMGKKYVFGNKPYAGLEDFETSASRSRARFDYYQDYKFHNQEAQLCAPSFGWVREGARLNHEIMHRTYKNLPMPLLILQAESDQSVSCQAQNDFVELLKSEGKENVALVQIPESKHEIFNSSDEVVEKFYNCIFQL